MEIKFDRRKIDYEYATEYFKDKVVCFTGKGFLVRGELFQIIRSIRGITTNTVTNKTDILIVGSKPGSKLGRAERYGTEIITIDQFQDILMGIGKEKLNKIEDIDIKTEWFNLDY